MNNIIDIETGEVDYENVNQKHYYNQHTLYVRSGVAYPSQLMDSLKKAIEETTIKVNKPIPCRYKVNLIVGRSGKYYGFGYIWVTNPEVYYMLIGKNPDGSERVIYEDDPNWKEPEKSLEETLDNLKCSNKSWADDLEEEEELRKQYNCPQIKKELPILMTLPGYEYDTEQLEHVKKLALSEGYKGPIPTKGYFQISPAFVTDLDDKYCHNVLCSRNIPLWISEQDIKNIFIPYTSDSITKYIRKIKGKKIADTYPFVTINENRVAFITFHLETRDAQFALLMTRKVTLNNQNGESFVLIFNHSYNTSNYK